MSDDNPTPEEGEESTPDTNTDDVPNLEIEAPTFAEAIPVADEAPAAQAQAAPPPAPRSFPQHYSILFGSVVVLVAASSVWEREHIFGVEISGPDRISGAFLLTLALYSVIVSILNIVQGRLRGMLAAFLTCVTAIYLGVGNWLDTRNADNFQGWSDFGKVEGSSFQDRIGMFVGQFSPGMWLSFVGGGLILLVFLKAIFGGGGKKAPAPAPRRGRR